MKNKIIAYFKGKNPYMIASCAVMIITVGIIFVLLQGADTAPAEELDESLNTEQIIIVEESIEAFIESEEQSDIEVLPDLETVESKVKESETVESDEVENESVVSESDLPKEDFEEEIAESKAESIPTKTPEVETESSNQEETIPEPEEQEPEKTEEDTPIQQEPVLQPEEESTPVEEVHVHSWIFESYYQEPTCSNGGLITEICAHCGETQITGGTPTGMHEFKVETYGDCCSAEVVVCAICNYREVREKDLKNHIDVEDGFCYGCGCKIE